MTLDDLYARDVRRHRLTGRLLDMAHTLALFMVLWVAGIAVLGGWMMFLGGLVRM